MAPSPSADAASNGADDADAPAPAAGGASGREAARAIAARQRGGGAPPASSRPSAAGDAGGAAPPPPPRSRTADAGGRPAPAPAADDRRAGGQEDADAPPERGPRDAPRPGAEPPAPVSAGSPPPAPDETVSAEEVAPPAEAAPAEPDAAPAAPAGDDVSFLWTDRVVAELRGMTKALFKLGHVVDSTPDVVTVGLPNSAHLERCQQKREEAEAALVKALGRPVRLALVVGGDDGEPSGDRSAGPRPPTGPQADEHVDLEDLVDAPNDDRTTVDRVTDAFPGARVVDP